MRNQLAVQVANTALERADSSVTMKPSASDEDLFVARTIAEISVASRLNAVQRMFIYFLQFWQGLKARQHIYKGIDEIEKKHNGE